MTARAKKWRATRAKNLAALAPKKRQVRKTVSKLGPVLFNQHDFEALIEKAVEERVQKRLADQVQQIASALRY